MRKVVFLVIITSCIFSCKRESSTDNVDKYLNFYIMDIKHGGALSGFYLSKDEDGSFYGKSFSATKKVLQKVKKI